MASRPIIVCPQCRSWNTAKVEPVSWWDRVREWYRIRPSAGDRLAGAYACGSCRSRFDVRSSEEHCRAHPPDIFRCRSCDCTALELVERNHRYSEWQPPEEVVDLYRCAHCGNKIMWIVREDPSTLYD